MNKRGFEFSFAWIFAIVIGVFVLFLAIYAAMKVIDVGQQGTQTKTAKEISIIFNPLETGLASGKSSLLRLNAETRIYNKCSLEGSFGRQSFSTSQKLGFSKDWPKPGDSIILHNKYVFSDETEDGKEFYFFSKPFNMPFKVSELIFMSSKKYCFVNAPGFIEDEIKQLELKNVKIENCSSQDVKVCFSRTGNCNVSVYGDCSGICSPDYGEYEFGHTIKNGKEVYYISSLLYGTIFSEPEVYNCNFKRLMSRIIQISNLYKEEAGFLASRGCGDVIALDLIKLSQAASNARNSTSPLTILNLREAEEALDSQNLAQGNCGIYEWVGK